MPLAFGTIVDDNRSRQDEWLFALRRNLPNIYQPLGHVRLVNILLVIFLRKDSKLRIVDVCNNSMPTGFLGQWGNKGGVGMSMRINDTTICFINSHLAAGENELLRRNQDFRSISQMRFGNKLGIYDHDVVIWLGDLNYRLETNLSYEEIIYYIEMKCYKELLFFDQLKIQQKVKTAFNGFHEESPKFRPSYKYDVGTQRWDSSEKKRVPAWCDRILYWIKDKNVKIEQKSYHSLEKVTLSDHKPVCSNFVLQAKTIDPVKKADIYEKMLRESDRKANELLPQVNLSCTEHDFGKIFYQEPAVFVLEIQNTGLTPTHFVFKPSGKNESFENWLTITPKSSFLDVGTTIEVTIQASIDDEELCRITADVTQLSTILVLHLDGGRDYFVIVSATYQRKKPRPPSEVNDLIIFD